jgi:membrane protein
MNRYQREPRGSFGRIIERFGRKYQAFVGPDSIAGSSFKPVQTAPGVGMLKRLRPVLTIAQEVWREFHTDKGTLFAAAISFFGLFSLIPLMLLAIGIFGYFIGSKQAMHQVLAFIGDYVPTGTEVLESYLMQLSKDAKLLSGIGLLGLLWAGTQVFVIIQQVMNIALGSTRHVGLLRGRGMAVILVLVAGALFVLSIGITSLLTAARQLQPEYFAVRVGLIWRFSGVLVSFIISVLAFIFIYKFTPTKSIGMSGPTIGGLTAGFLFEGAKYVFKWYVTSIPNFSRVYGSLGSVVVLVLWIYYMSLITVIGAEVASVYARREGERLSGGS